jgi:hypothetical protein
VSRLVKKEVLGIKDKITGGLRIPTGTTTERNGIIGQGEIRYNTTTSNFEFFDGSTFKNVAIKGSVTITKDSFTGDGSTLAYTLSITPADENNILVFVGNVFQNPDVAYTLSGATITFASAPPLSQTVVVLHGFDSTST